MNYFKNTGSAVLALLVMVVMSPGALAVDIQKATTPGGIDFLLVEDYTVPIISVSLSFAGGTTQDPQGKEGQLRLLTSMLDEGAGPYDSQAFQARMEDIGVELGFSAGRDRVIAGLRTLASEAGPSFELLRLALNEPRFEEEPLKRIKNAYVSGIKRAENNPRYKGQVALRKAAYGDHPYRESGRGTAKSLGQITPDDLKKMHKQLFARDNLFIGVVGAIDAERLGVMLDKLFSELPEKSNRQLIEEASIQFGSSISVSADIPQASVSFVFPGVKRNHSDFFATHIMNHILGGGTFSSRLYREVREKRGLAYGVSSSLVVYDHAAAIVSSTSTRADRLGEAMGVIREEFKRMAEAGPTQAELDAAKKFITGTYAITNLDTSPKIAGVLVAIQQAKLGLDYIDKRQEYIAAVSLDDVKRIAKQLLSVEPLVVTVGPEQG